MQRKKKGHHWSSSEFLALEVFLGVTLFGLLVGALFTYMFAAVPAAAPPAPMVPQSPMTEDEYRAETKDVMAPFVARVGTLTEADMATLEPSFRDTVSGAQDKLLAMSRIPKSSQQTHLALVLLLDKWKRALDGSEADSVDVLEKTKQTLADDPWLTEGAAAQQDVEPAAPAPAPAPAPQAH